MSEKSILGTDNYHLIVGIIFFAFVIFAVLDNFSDSHQVEANAKLAVEQCGEGNVKSVTTTSFTCKS
ncbi:hypothetical protein tloyanaT_15240 [Thalassotalea loyana]|uniref:Uncharacterized protein n=1 Tax=Thalassotalea loyana TaxID=280483 RepID=A0ABQ6HAX9_9GAMM|nr:hypothetical protein [Thalassotalea loyana]GLX85272.1 hypothetical protein tloyanaT_15240 [Thalassotalea loyana]